MKEALGIKEKEEEEKHKEREKTTYAVIQSMIKPLLTQSVTSWSEKYLVSPSTRARASPPKTRLTPASSQSRSPISAMHAGWATISPTTSKPVNTGLPR